MISSYCDNYIKYRRRSTIEVNVGGIPMGAPHPVRIQSMTNTPTCAIGATTDQIVRIQNAGADYVRVTVPSPKDADCLKQIMYDLRTNGLQVPVIADIHFNPAIAISVAGIVNKVRINPGNFTGAKKTTTSEYTATEYQDELNEVRLQLLPLIESCIKNKTSLRIGTNHGSLSDRIMSRFGDTPEGMAESAMEFLRICRDENFDQVVVSMKASNTRTMVHATRLLVEKMNLENMHFPLHLGVTEAGEGDDGRIRSAIGIGTLMADGLGDTIRVSLTEDPEAEIPVARKIVDYFQGRENQAPIVGFGEYPINAYDYRRRKTHEAGMIGHLHPVVVVMQVEGNLYERELDKFGWHLSPDKGWITDELSADVLSVESWPEDLPIPDNKAVLVRNSASGIKSNRQLMILMDWEAYEKQGTNDEKIKCIRIPASELDENKINQVSGDSGVVLILETDNLNGFADQRAAICRLINNKCTVPVILKRNYNEHILEDFQIKSACDLGGLFIDGMGEGIWLGNSGALTEKEIVSTAFGILQFSRVRISKTEYISCPSCGRTLFDLQTTTRKIREKTSHLKGLKIGIMGCIVNGPGEMADADYGYVGTGRGKITLYKDKAVIKKNIPEDQAVAELIQLIKMNGDWTEP